jgi:hypothetical protein
MPLENAKETAANILRMYEVFQEKNENPLDASLHDISMVRKNSMTIVQDKYKKPDSDDDMDIREDGPQLLENPNVPNSWMCDYGPDEYPID